MIINIIVPRLSRTRFSGGIWCVFEYASGLAGKGHTVNIIPLLPSPRPAWYDLSNINFITMGPWQRTTFLFRQLALLVRNGFLATTGSNRLAGLLENFRNILHGINILGAGILPFELKQGTGIRYLRAVAPEADVTLATSYDTALPVRISGNGKCCYFMQHFEPYFSNESPLPELAWVTASQSYTLGLAMIANSTWLQQKITRETGAADVKLCVNAIDHRVFNGRPRKGGDSGDIRIISYGGRNAEWKGFREMAQAVAIARAQLPGINIIWRVYGDALLPPDNDIAPYESLGFLAPPELAAAYRDCDLLLSASWYESFPLFPLEAMACGLPVITTRFGTEDYAFHEDTAHIVDAKSPDSIAAGIRKLIAEPQYRDRLAENGHRMSLNFTWEKSIHVMESLLTGELAAGTPLLSGIRAESA